YKPGSAKARNCADGRERMYRFCQEHGIAHDRCGKLVVATRRDELPALEELERRGLANGLTGMVRLDAAGLKDHEPNVVGIAGLLGDGPLRRILENGAAVLEDGYARDVPLAQQARILALAAATGARSWFPRSGAGGRRRSRSSSCRRRQTRR